MKNPEGHCDRSGFVVLSYALGRSNLLSATVNEGNSTLTLPLVVLAGTDCGTGQRVSSSGDDVTHGAEAARRRGSQWDNHQEMAGFARQMRKMRGIP